jgi:thiamine-phosphate pyrophosphorylase
VLDVWLRAGVTLVQLRAKSLGTGAFLDLADAVRTATARSRARLIVNDRADIARMVGADGVHVGQDDLPAADVRRLLGAHAEVGVSTHNEDQVRSALAVLPSYLAIGPVFPTTGKGRPADPEVGLDGVKRAADLAGVAGCPLVAIGGITIGRAAGVLAAGAAAIAVISDLLEGDLRARVEDYLRVTQAPSA